MSPVQSGGGDHRRAAVEAIERARLAIPLRAGKAAEQAGISPSWWSAVVAGKKTRRGQTETVEPSIETLIDMARVVGNESEVRQILGLSPSPPATAKRPGAGDRSSDRVTLDRIEWERQLAEAFQAGLRAGRASSELSPQSEAG